MSGPYVKTPRGLWFVPVSRVGGGWRQRRMVVLWGQHRLCTVPWGVRSRTEHRKPLWLLLHTPRKMWRWLPW